MFQLLCGAGEEVNEKMHAFSSDAEFLDMLDPQVPFLFDHTDQSSSQSGPGSSKSTSDDMARGTSGGISRLSTVKANAMDSLLDTRNPALNSTLDGVLKIGGV